MRAFTIRPVLNGYIVDCGCQTLVFASNEALLDAISKYVTEPQKTERYFLENSLHSDLVPNEVPSQGEPGDVRNFGCFNPRSEGQKRER